VIDSARVRAVSVASLLFLVGGCRAHVGRPFGAGLGPDRGEALARCDGRAPAIDVAAIVERTGGAVVSVVAGRASDHHHVFSEHGGRAREHALGSGVLLTSDGLVLTSRHVIVDADDVRVELVDGRSFRGVVVARDTWLDVALIRLRAASGLPIAVLGSSASARVGDPVLAIGNPFGLGPSVTRGILSAKDRSIDDGPSEIYLQTDASVNPGDSGGPLLDAAGLVIGINAAVLDHGQGLSFAVPIDDVRASLTELLAKGKIQRGHAGVTYQAIDAPLSRALSLRGQAGVIVTEVDAGGPSARAGVREGDVIETIDGEPIARASDLAHALGRRRPGAVVRFGIQRDGRTRSIGVLLDRLASEDDDASRAPSAREREKASGLGLRAADANGEGARVEAVDPDKRAADDLRPGDVVVEVNRRTVKSALDLERELARASRPSTALLRVRREAGFLYVGVDLE
jgi:serine protease Do